MSLAQQALALRVVHFLEVSGCTVQVTKVDVEIHVHYTLKNDIKPQPAIRVTDKPSLIIPKGSQDAVVFAFLQWLQSPTED